MAKKTLYKIFAFGVSVITITAVLILSVFYSYSDNQLKEQLRVVESVVANQLAQDDDTAFISNHIDKNVRITLVAKDGTVIADSQESANKLGNHLDRQEIQQAIKNGEATVTRHSDTQGKKVYYFAKQLSGAMQAAGASLRGRGGIRYIYYQGEVKQLVESSHKEVRVERSFTILEDVNCPAVLAEQCFVTSDTDVARFGSEDGCKRTARAYYEAICAYFETTPLPEE